MEGFVLVGGWPGSGKTTLSRALAGELGFDGLSKDEFKEDVRLSSGMSSSAGCNAGPEVAAHQADGGAVSGSDPWVEMA
jgi:predicted kinase